MEHQMIGEGLAWLLPPLNQRGWWMERGSLYFDLMYLNMFQLNDHWLSQMNIRLNFNLIWLIFVCCAQQHQTCWWENPKLWWRCPNGSPGRFWQWCVDSLHLLCLFWGRKTVWIIFKDSMCPCTLKGWSYSLDLYFFFFFLPGKQGHQVGLKVGLHPGLYASHQHPVVQVWKCLKLFFSINCPSADLQFWINSVLFIL